MIARWERGGRAEGGGRRAEGGATCRPRHLHVGLLRDGTMAEGLGCDVGEGAADSCNDHGVLASTRKSKIANLGNTIFR